MIPEMLQDAEAKMQKSLEVTRHEFTLIRTGRASPTILEHVQVNYFGQELPIQQVATITVPEPRTLMIAPWDKGALPAIEKAILKSDLNLTPNNDGNSIRLNIPTLTEERRRELIKQLHKKAEDGHVAIRNVRHETNNHLKAANKKGDISEDDEKRAQDKLQKLTDKYIVEVDKAVKIKEAELLEV
ncbi:MAG: ribosome recycling factor [Armatimonadetes bacterium]|nr:ribosome recycling factor [Armatimonadota bacterium]